MMPIDDVIDALGGNKEVAALFGVGSSAVSNWRSAGRFPERLHLRVYRICQERGIEYDPALYAKHRDAAA